MSVDGFYCILKTYIESCPLLIFAVIGADYQQHVTTKIKRKNKRGILTVCIISCELVLDNGFTSSVGCRITRMGSVRGTSAKLRNL